MAGVKGRDTRLPLPCPLPLISYPSLIVVLEPQMRDELLADHVAQRVLQLHQLNEQIVLGIQAGRVHRTLEVEREPLLDPRHSRAFCEVEEQREIENDRRRQNAVATQEV